MISHSQLVISAVLKYKNGRKYPKPLGYPNKELSSHNNLLEVPRKLRYTI